MRKAPEGRNRHQGALTLIFVMASSGVVKVILSFYRDDEGSAFERHRGRVPFDIEKHNARFQNTPHLLAYELNVLFSMSRSLREEGNMQISERVF